ncbi:hypothetical protein TL16_g05701, partial [Triparma laevis f. inornata]
MSQRDEISSPSHPPSEADLLTLQVLKSRAVSIKDNYKKWVQTPTDIINVRELRNLRRKIWYNITYSCNSNSDNSSGIGGNKKSGKKGKGKEKEQVEILVDPFPPLPCHVNQERRDSASPIYNSKSSSFSSSDLIHIRHHLPSKPQPSLLKLSPLSIKLLTPPSLPPSSSTVWLSKNHYTTDTTELGFIPWFGDDDKEDLVSDVYDVKRRERMLESGPVYLRKSNLISLKKLLNLLTSKTLLPSTPPSPHPLYTKPSPPFSPQNNIAPETHVNWDTSSSYYSIFCGVEEWSNVKKDEAFMIWVKGFKDFKDDTGVIDSNITDLSFPSPEKPSNINVCKPCKAEGRSMIPEVKEGQKSYSEVMDSYHNLFCRRCFTYDCNLHGVYRRPDLDIMAEDSVRRDRDGEFEWFDTRNAKKSEVKNGGDSNDDLKSKKRKADTGVIPDHAIPTPKKSPKKSPQKLITPQSSSPRTSIDGPYPFLPSLCLRAYLALNGDTERVANFLNVDEGLVKKCLEENEVGSENLVIGRSVSNKVGKGTKMHARQGAPKLSGHLLKLHETKTVHAPFEPCVHDGPCTSHNNCSCISSVNFCTKHCVWGLSGMNTFLGCKCKNGQCRTKACPCFANKRECDPDVCVECGAGTDPPTSCTGPQRCKNDGISFRRHKHLLVSESGIPNGGWGLYTKADIKKDDFIQEYVGELISQEEADRRGRIYDKVNRSYLFNLNSEYVVDATRKGNKTKFANHLSAAEKPGPNCYTKVMIVNGDHRIGLFANQDIDSGEELFFDYRYEIGVESELLTLDGIQVDWMKDGAMANQINKRSLKRESAKKKN